MKLKLFFLCFLFSVLGLSQNREIDKTNSALNSNLRMKLVVPTAKQPTLQPKNSKEKRNFRVSKSKILESQNISPLEMTKEESEVLSKRDAFSKHYRNNDGTYTAVISSGEINYKKNGRWEEINTVITTSSRPGFSYANTSNSLESYFGKDVANGVISKTEKGEVTEFLNTKMYWEVNGRTQSVIQSSNVSPEMQTSKIYYRNLYPNIDAEFSVQNAKRKLNYLIPSKSALGNIPTAAEYLVFSEDIQLPQGWSHKINSKNDVEILNAQGELALIYAKPSVIENYDNDDEETKILENNPASFSVSQNQNILTFLVKVKTTWLNAADTKYPVAVDPTVYPDNATYWTGWVRGNGTGNDDNMVTGYTSGFFSFGFAKFNLTSIPNNSVIANVQSNSYYYGRNGNLSSRDFAIVDVPVDVADSSVLYADILNSINFYISNINAFASNNPSPAFYSNTFTNSGIAYVQDALSQNYVCIGIAPYTPTKWGYDNYAWFRGYSNSNKPQLVITYADASYSCNPQSSSGTYYIKNVQFLGTLLPDTSNPDTGYSAGGYGNYTSLTNQAKQIPGGVINLRVKTDGNNAFMKAWVDWNKDGKFDSTEKVYDTQSIYSPNSVFGFVVPVGTTPGMYTIRIRTKKSDTWYYGPCKTVGDGETEDYQFEVIADCAAKITGVNITSTDGHRCGTGTVTLSASSTGATSYKWYTTRFGGSPISGATGSTYTTPSLSATTTYFVTAVSGSCESVYRTPVVARIDPTPTISFTMDKPDICGNNTTISVGTLGDKEEVTILNENFNSGLGSFQNVVSGSSYSDADWKSQNSPFKPTRPPYYIVSPAIASGYSGAKYAAAITDVHQNSNILNRLVLTNPINASSLTNLKLDFDLYYEPLITNDTSYSYLRVEASSDNGANWSPITTFTSTQGNPGVWSQQSLSLPASFQTSQLKIRFSIFSYGNTYTSGSTTYTEWDSDIASIDNVRVYGDKPLSTNFTWSGSVIFAPDCVSTVPVGGSPNICVKPTATQLEADVNWTINASATLSNGCVVIQPIIVANSTKVWNPATDTDWAVSVWKPATPIPDANKCIIIKKPVNVNLGTDGLGKNMEVMSGGKLNIKSGGSVTITDFIKNFATGDDFVVADGGNLLQINDNAANTGDMSAQKTFTLSTGHKEYNYVISPVVGQNLSSIYPGVQKVMYHNEATNYFYTSSGAYIAGRALAVKEPTMGTSIPGNFKGGIFNGTLDYTLSYTSGKPAPFIPGYNLVGNPYPSNLDVKALYTDNSTKIEATFYFWDNRGNTIHYQMGSTYTQNQYAFYNASSGMGTSAPNATSLRIPNRYVKVGTGFMIRALSTANGLKLNYKNAYRSKDNTGPGYLGKKAEAEADRYWITLTTPQNLSIMNGITYFVGGNNGFAPDDTPTMDGSDDLYSIVEGEHLTINGKAPFVNTDVIQLGTNAFENGIYKISLYDKEGVFANGQKIYLKDKQTGILTELTAGDYSFAATAGTTENRFEIWYRPEGTLGTQTAIKSGVEVYKDGQDFVVRTGGERIEQVELYDASGRLLYQVKPQSKEVRIDNTKLVNGVYVLKIGQKSTTVVKKVMK